MRIQAAVAHTQCRFPLTFFELDLGGHEWTREAGGDAWSGPRLILEADGTRQEHGDIEQMLQGMLEVRE